MDLPENTVVNSYEYNKIIRKLYKESPEKALEYAFRCGEDSCFGSAYFVVAHKDAEGTLWSRFRTLKREELEGRKYKLSLQDTNPAHVVVPSLTPVCYNSINGLDRRTRGLIKMGGPLNR